MSWTNDIFDRVSALLADYSREVVMYDGEFLDPDKIAELQNRYSTKNGCMYDIEEVLPIGKDADNKHPLCRIVVVVYGTVSNKRSAELKVRGSMELATEIAKAMTGQFVLAGSDHSHASFEFLEIQKEDQIPFVSVHAVRFALQMVVKMST